MNNTSETDNTSDLRDYLNKAKHNIGGPYPECISVADQLLFDCANNLDRNQHLTSARLFQIGFGSWRASVALALTGAASQVPVILRHALECATYAFLCARNKEFEETWWLREQDEAAKKRLRGKDGPIPTAKTILESENPELKGRISQTLDVLIDFGAHPNVMLFADNSEIEELEGVERYATKLLGSEEARNSAFLITSAVALDMASLYRLVWPIRFGARQEQYCREVAGQAEVFRNFHHSQSY